MRSFSLLWFYSLWNRLSRTSISHTRSRRSCSRAAKRLSTSRVTITATSCTRPWAPRPPRPSWKRKSKCRPVTLPGRSALRPSGAWPGSRARSPLHPRRPTSQNTTRQPGSSSLAAAAKAAAQISKTSKTRCRGCLTTCRTTRTSRFPTGTPENTARCRRERYKTACIPQPLATGFISNFSA